MPRWSLALLVILALARCPHALAGETAAPPAASASIDETVPVPVPEPTPKALQYHRTGNWLWAFDELWALAVPAVILASGLSGRMRDLSRAIGRYWLPTVALYAALYTLLIFLIDLPLTYYQGFLRQHAYGLSNQTIGRWLSNTYKALGVSVVGALLFAWVPFLLLRKAPRRWWLYTAILTIPFEFFIMLIAPIWIDPLFHKFGPPKDKVLERKILDEAHRAGIDGSRVFEANMSVDTKRMNAYVKGLLGSKRIVLWDTLLAKLDERQVLFVMGHEMGHYVLGHVPRTILLSFFVVLAGLYWVDRAGQWLIQRFSARFRFDRLADVASVPLILILLQIASLILSPIALAYSRYQEHEADRFALELTRTNRSGALAFAKLQEENLGIPRPGPFYKLWRSTHPSIGERIEFANSYHPWRERRPLTYGELFRP